MPTPRTRRAALVTAAVFCLLAAWGVPAAHAQDGAVFIDVTNVLGQPLPARVVLHPKGGGDPVAITAPKGSITAPCPAGAYDAYVYVYDWDAPVLVEKQEVTVPAGDRAFVAVNLLEGAGARDRIRAFDRDGDLAIDRVEAAAGTDPGNAAEFPGATPAPYASRVLSKEAGWYKGDLHVKTSHGDGAQSVAEAVRRAEQRGLDFIAIADQNTLAAARDDAFTSDQVVLIPAMAWGSDDEGWALIYGPRTVPPPPGNMLDGQGVVYRVQAQGGVVAAAHPCFPTAPWQRGYSFMNLIEVWAREWRKVPPGNLDLLASLYRARDDKGQLVHSIAEGISTPDISANAQAAIFWDRELRRGLRASPIGGSLSGSADVPMGEPCTWVYAPEKSVDGILDGLRRGRTVVTRSPDGPRLFLQADILMDNTIDVSIGGLIPTHVPVEFHVTVENAPDAKLQLLRDGRVVLTKIIEQKSMLLKMRDLTEEPVVYRARVVRPAEEPGFGPLDVLAISGPIYARHIIVLQPGMDPVDMWVKLENENPNKTEVEQWTAPDGRTIWRTRPQEHPAGQPEVPIQPGEPVKQITPEQWRF